MQARDARLAGEPAEAIRLLDRWLASHPGDVDAMLQLGLALLALGRLDEAESQFAAVLTIAPDYADAREGIAQIAARRSDLPSLRSQVSIDGGISLVEGPATNWQDAGVLFATSIDPRTTISGSGTYYRRFGLEDVELGGGLTRQFGRDTWLRMEAGATPNASFRPEAFVSVGADWRLAQSNNATVVTADVRHQEFPTQAVTTVSPSIVQYLADGRVWVTARVSGLIAEGDNHLRLGWLGRVDYAPVERYRLFGGFARGADTELGVVSNVSNVFGGAELPIGETLSLMLSAAQEWREAGADRTDFRIGFKVEL
ncbi:YaiO family outer membrane beta-barrel protein [Alteraurantiacibacter buctensis]|nr:YaiO family outer membrane beta-barrel protein [Alteraurantiacibacter buctensis]